MSLSPETPWSFGGYRALLTELQARGLAPTPRRSADPTQPHLFVRHDVDLSLAHAVAIAELENAINVPATYYVLLTSEFYNLATANGRSALRRLIDLGHEVGLHFDAALSDSSLNALDASAARECAMLEDLIGARVDTISFHRPAKALQGLDVLLAGRTHAYQPRYFTEFGYCSDSMGQWRFGHPFDHERVAQKRGLHLLTHPIWWAREAPQDPIEVLHAFLGSRLDTLNTALAQNLKPYAQWLAEGGVRPAL